jgi:hypothetical protein
MRHYEFITAKGRKPMQNSVVGLFDDFADAQATLQELTTAGIPHDNISVIAPAPAEEHRSTTADSAAAEETADTALSGAATGAAVGAGLGLLASLFLPGLGPLVAVGWIATALGGAAVGAAAGGLIGALAGAGVPDELAGYYTEGVRRGGSLVVTRGITDEQAEIARNVIQRHDPVDIEERAAEWSTRGWSGYDPESQPFTPEEQELEPSQCRRAA